MRFVAIALFLLAIPVLQALMKGNLRNQRYVWMAIGFIPFTIGFLHLDASIISWPMWPGYVKGMLVSFIDSCAIAVLLVLPGKRGRTPLVWLLIVFMLVAAAAIAFAQEKQAAFFFVWQLGRMLLVCLAASRIAAQPDGARYILYGMMGAAILQAGYSINERFHGIAQAGGTLGHQNMMGMAIHFAIYPALALLLSGRRDPLLLVGFVAGVIAVGLTGSRATLGLAVGGIVLTIVLSMIMRPSGRKTSIAGVGVLAMLAMSPLAYNSLTARLSADALASSDLERDAFKRAAWMMIDDHPMGVGANQYVVVANTQGYSARAGVAWNSANRSANVHDTYLLMTAELGYLGGAVFMALMVLPIFAALRFAWAMRRDPRGELGMGLGVALLAVAGHCLYEWIYVTYPIQYLHGIAIGMLAGLIRQQRLAARPARRRARPSVMMPQPEPQPVAARSRAVLQ